jgi:hypothetical protein
MRAEPDQLYRLQRQGVFDLAGGDFYAADVNCGESPRDPRFPTGQWYCDGEGCAVREVTVNAKYLVDDPPSSPPVMRCPTCGEPMRFQNYLDQVLLMPVRPGEDIVEENGHLHDLVR